MASLLSSSSSSKKHTVRLITFAVFTVLLHLASLLWVSGLNFSSTPATAPVLETQLITPEPVKIAAAVPAHKAPLRKSVAPPVPQTPTETITPQVASQAQATPPSEGAKEGAQSNAVAGTGDDLHSTSKKAQEGKQPFNFPPTAKIIYESFYYSNQNADASIDWHWDGSNYSLQFNFPPYLNTLSKGGQDAYGLAPDRYEEKTIARSLVAANFNRDAERHSISFSKVTSILPLVDGAQDRFSFALQLVGYVRGNPNAYSQGKVLPFFIVDSDSGENWRMQMVGDETFALNGRSFRTKHFIRLPRREDDPRSVELWLAEELGWLPAKIRFADTDKHYEITANYKSGAPQN